MISPFSYFERVFRLSMSPIRGGTMADKQNRCWPGYEPVPGKKQHSQGSCKPKAESKSSPSEKDFRAKRRKQLDEKQAEHPGRRPQSLQHLGPPARTKKGATKSKAASGNKSQRASDTKKSSTKQARAAAKKPVAKKAVAKKAAAKKSSPRKVTAKERPVGSKNA